MRELSAKPGAATVLAENIWELQEEKKSRISDLKSCKVEKKSSSSGIDFYYALFLVFCSFHPVLSPFCAVN